MSGPNQPEVTTSYATGRAGANVAAAEVRLSSGLSIRASLSRGRLAAWWPTADSAVALRGYDGAGNLVGSWP